MVKIDDRLLLWITGLAGTFGPLDWVASHLANDYLIPVLMTLIAASLWFWGNTAQRRRENQLGFIAGITGLGISAAAVAIIDANYFRDRPYIRFPEIVPTAEKLFYLPTVSSFPSYPAAVLFALAFGVWLRNKKAGTVLFVLAALMGLARVYVGVHYPSDIVGGALIGIAITYVIFWLLKTAGPILNVGFWILEHIWMA